MLVISVNRNGGRVVCAGEGLSDCDQWAEIDFRYALVYTCHMMLYTCHSLVYPVIHQLYIQSFFYTFGEVSDA